MCQLTVFDNIIACDQSECCEKFYYTYTKNRNKDLKNFNNFASVHADVSV